MNHLSINLEVMLLESLSLDRTLVLKNPKFAAVHNHNHNISIDSSWHKYYDIKKTIQNLKIQETKQKEFFNYIDFENFLKKHFAKDEVLIVALNEAITDEQNKKYKVIIRSIYNNYLVLEPAFKKYLPNGKIIIYSERMCLQKRIIQEAQSVKKQLKNYCAIHIRRTDRTSENTTPEKILKILQKNNPQKLPVFLMTDEPNRDFYKNLYSEFQIYRYDDFDNLRQVAAAKDNHFLYLIEKEIHKQAENFIPRIY